MIKTPTTCSVCAGSLVNVGGPTHTVSGIDARFLAGAVMSLLAKPGSVLRSTGTAMLARGISSHALHGPGAKPVLQCERCGHIEALPDGWAPRDLLRVEDYAKDSTHIRVPEAADVSVLDLYMCRCDLCGTVGAQIPLIRWTVGADGYLVCPRCSDGKGVA